MMASTYPLRLLLLLVMTAAAACTASARPAPDTTASPVAATVPAAQVRADSADEARLALQVLERFFDGMRTRDTALMRRQVLPDVMLLSAGGPRGLGAPLPMDQFIAGIGRSTGEPLNEQLIAPEVRVDGRFASIWTRYTFALGQTVQHCGVDAVHLVRGEGGWKIAFLSDSRREEGCPDATPQSDTTAARIVAGRFLEALVARDTVALNTLTVPGFRYFAVNDATGQLRWTEGEAFRRDVTQPGPALDERMGLTVTRQDGPLAEVWAPYTFRVDGTRSHCGVDGFQLVKIGAEWKVFHLGYNTRRDNCDDARYQPR